MVTRPLQCYVIRTSPVLSNAAVTYVVATGLHTAKRTPYSYYVILEARAPVMKLCWFKHGLAQLVIFALWLKSTVFI